MRIVHLRTSLSLASTQTQRQLIRATLDASGVTRAAPTPSLAARVIFRLTAPRFPGNYVI